ncbi:MAG TPA: hypothetical protein VKY85_19350 [Candidatus Angelobacter sp.]|nr:hypothetical protein [Candidatus Angelobacter sp.]
MRFAFRTIPATARFTLVLLLVLTCATSGRTGPAQWSDDLWRHYDETVSDAAAYRHENVRHLHPLKFDPATMTTTVVTLTGYDYPMGSQSLSRNIWVTAVPEVQQKCQAFTDPDLELRLRQLLGLQPNAKIGNFVTMTINWKDVFRPAPNPLVTSEWPCADPREATCGELFPGWVSSDHIAFVANQMLTSYIVSADHNGAYSYPWTRLGYTYDWKPGADRYGASEYVIRSGASVNVTDKTPYAAYCGRK